MYSSQLFYGKYKLFAVNIGNGGFFKKIYGIIRNYQFNIYLSRTITKNDTQLFLERFLFLLLF